MVHRLLMFALFVLLALPALADNRTVQFLSVNGQPVAGAKIYYREFTGRIDSVSFGPTGFTEEVLTTDANGRVQIDKEIPQRMPSAFGSDYALVIAEGYTPQLVSLFELQNQVYMRPITYLQLKLVLPDGTPAAGAIFVATAIGGKTFQLNNQFSGISTPYFRVTADRNGIAMLPCVRRAIQKDGVSGVLINGIAITNGYLAESVSLQSMGPEAFVITLNKTQQVHGVVTDANGRAIAGATIRCAEYTLPEARTDQQGNFVFRYLPTSVPPLVIAGRTVDGTLTVYIDAPGFSRQGVSLLPTAAKTDLCRITMEPLVTISGKIIDRNTGQPIINSRKYGYNILVRHNLGQYGEGRFGSTLFVTNQDGTFTAQIPRQACLEVNNSITGSTRNPFTPQDYHEGDIVTLQTVSR